MSDSGVPSDSRPVARGSPIVTSASGWLTQRAEHQRVDDAERGGVGANAEGEDQDDDAGERGCCLSVRTAYATSWRKLPSRSARAIARERCVSIVTHSSRTAAESPNCATARARAVSASSPCATRAWVRMAMWKSISWSTSRLRCLAPSARRNGRRVGHRSCRRYGGRRSQRAGRRLHEAVPRGDAALEPAASRGAQPVELRVPIVLGQAPLGHHELCRSRRWSAG